MQSEIKEIIFQAKKGDQHAFRKLVELHQQYAFSLAFRIVCNEEEAKDIVQESFIKIWKHIKEFNPKLKFTTWMYKIVTNSAIDKLRSIKQRNFVYLDGLLEKLEESNNDQPDIQLSNAEISRFIGLIADDLPQKQRLVFILRDIQGLESAEVETILELPETSIKSNLYHARKIVREKLQNIMTYERRVT